MGVDKALLSCGGRPLVSHALSLLRNAGLPVAIAGARSPLGTFAPVVEDPVPDRGPLGGICSALASTSALLAVFLPVDLPLIPSSLVACLVWRALITGAAVTLPVVGGFAQTFPAVVDRELLPGLQRRLQAGNGGCFTAFQAAAAEIERPVDAVPVEFLVQCGQIAHPAGLPAVRWFLNVNEPGDLVRAAKYMVSADQVI
jgi:molybdopterin-guanine dinucleotide biosynthesis protein A